MLLLRLSLPDQQFQVGLSLLVKVTQSCLTLCGPVNWSPPGSFVLGILQARMLECHSLRQGIFLTQRSNLDLLHCRQILSNLSHWASQVVPKPKPLLRTGEKSLGINLLYFKQTSDDVDEQIVLRHSKDFL